MTDDDNLNSMPAGTLPIDTDEPAPTYPVPEDKRIGVNTSEGTKPEIMDQGDEEVTREASRQPEDWLS